MFPSFRSNKAVHGHRDDRLFDKQELKEKYSFLLKPSQRHHIISAFIPKNLVFFTSPRRKEKSPLRVVELYNKEKPREDFESKNSKYFKSISPKLINFLCPAKLYSKRLPKIKVADRKSVSFLSEKLKPSKLLKIRNISSKTPDPTIKYSPKYSDNISNDCDKISTYMNMLNYL